MDNDKVMGRRKFFSRFFPILTETIVEKTKDETKISTNLSVITPSPNKAEVAEEIEEGGGRKYPWAGM